MAYRLVRIGKSEQIKGRSEAILWQKKQKNGIEFNTAFITGNADGSVNNGIYNKDFREEYKDLVLGVAGAAHSFMGYHFVFARQAPENKGS